MPIPVAPTLPPAPDRTNPGQDFAAVAATFAAALVDFGPELNDFAAQLIVAAAAANASGTSTSSVTIGTGAKSFTVESGKMFVPGAPARVTDAANVANYMDGIITSYNFLTGALGFTCERPYGSGTKSAWHIIVTGPPGTGSDTLPSFTGNAGKVLAVASGEAGTEWREAARGWETIGTLSPSAAANVTFSSIPATFAELSLRFDLTASSATSMLASWSPDGSSFSSGVTFGASATTGFIGALYVPAYGRNAGVMPTCSIQTTNASPFGQNGSSIQWRCTGGISALRVAPGTGTITGTATLYGRR